MELPPSTVEHSFCYLIYFNIIFSPSKEERPAIVIIVVYLNFFFHILFVPFNNVMFLSHGRFVSHNILFRYRV